MRAFIAIELPKEIKKYLAGLQEQLKTAGADVKWVAPENIHLTLKFLGEIDEKKVNQVKEILAEVGGNKNSFPIRLSSLGAFPKINFPRIIWVGIDQGSAETEEIVRGLEQNFSQIGIPKEGRPFSSHITIGRMRSSLNRQKLVQELNNLVNKRKDNLEFLATKITLFKSTLTPKGPVYETLKEISLKNT